MLISPFRPQLSNGRTRIHEHINQRGDPTGIHQRATVRLGMRVSAPTAFAERQQHGAHRALLLRLQRPHHFAHALVVHRLLELKLHLALP